MLSFDTETEKLIEAEVAKRTRTLKRILFCSVIVVGSSTVITVSSAYDTSLHKDQALANNLRSQHDAQRAEQAAQESEITSQAMKKEVALLKTEVEKYKKLNAELAQEQEELARSIEDSRTCDKILASMQQLAGIAKRNKDLTEKNLSEVQQSQIKTQQEVAAIIERCNEVADKKFAECKKICESANVPPFWPQRL